MRHRQAQVSGSCCIRRVPFGQVPFATVRKLFPAFQEGCLFKKRTRSHDPAFLNCMPRTMRPGPWDPGPKKALF